jgi:succinate-acetate transporter protein
MTSRHLFGGVQKVTHDSGGFTAAGLRVPPLVLPLIAWGPGSPRLSKECEVMAIKDDTAQGGPPQQPVHNGTQQGVMALQEVAIKEVPSIADPAPLGLAAFALTTFLLSAFNVGWTKGTVAFLGFALAYGGIAQLLAGMWEFRNRNVFGATAFSTYGAFWIGVAVYFFWVVPEFKPTALELSNDLGWISVAFVIFNTYMLLWSLFVNRAVFLVFLTLEVTFILLAIGHFSNSTNMVKAGGIAGIVTAACAWYASAAGVINGMASRKVLPTGAPLNLNPAG